METRKALSKRLIELKSTLPELVLADYYEVNPSVAGKMPDSQQEQFKKGIIWTLSFLAEAIWTAKSELFNDSVMWGKTFFPSINLPVQYVAGIIDLLKNRLNGMCSPEETEIINPILEKAVSMMTSQDEQPSSLSAQDNKLSIIADTYLNLLLRGERDKALKLVMTELNAGKPIRDIYLDIFQPVQYEIGRLWQTNNISVAQEHYCTGATQLVMSQLYPYLFTGEKKNQKMVMTCVSGELHEMGARMVTDFFEMNGWDTYYLGANMPSESIVNYISETRPQCLAISATMTFHVNAVEELIKRVRSEQNIPSNLKILVGGYPFKVADGLWKTVGADGFAPNAAEAIELANRLITLKS
jgi:methanogenic corrinoid protein MtbC1